jgi:hypothetical protein
LTSDRDGRSRLLVDLLHEAEEQAEDDIHGRPEGLTATVLLKREIREFHDWLKWPGMAEEVPPDVRDSQGPMVRLAPQVACAGLIRDPSQLRGELAGTRPS